MNDVITNSTKIFSDIRTDFSSLWGSKIRGETLEIITPFSTLIGDSISVFITQRGDRFIISDGQYVTRIIHDHNLDYAKRNHTFLGEIASHYAVNKTMEDKEGNCFYFKSTNDFKLVSAYIYDIAFFQNTVVNSIYASQAFFEEEDKQEQYFSTRVNTVLGQKIEENKKSNRFFYIDNRNSEFKAFRFNTVLTREGSSDIWLAMYITGSSTSYFCNNICRANTGFGYIRSKPEFSPKIHISAIFDESAKGNDRSNDKVKIARAYMDTFHPTPYNLTEIEKIDDLDVLFRGT